MFLIFSFVLTYGLSASGILKRIAIYFINNKYAKKNIYCFMGLYFLSMLIVGSFMAPTTVFILYFGIIQEIFAVLGLQKGDKLARNLMIGTGFIASISCAMTPIAHTFPLMALGYYEQATGEVISYIQYLRYSLPIGLILAAAAYGLLCLGLNKSNYKLINFDFKNTSWAKKDILTISIFIITIIAWLFIGIWPTAIPILTALGTSGIAMISCLLMAITKCVNIKDGFSKGVSWNAILLCAATLAMGSFLAKDEFGVMPLLQNFMASQLVNVNILIFIAVFTVLLTNLISNIVTTTVSFNLIVPTLIAVTGLYSPIIATIAIGIGASLAYALPSSIAHIALAGSSGWAESKDMLKYGIPMIAISVLTMILIIGG